MKAKVSSEGRTPDVSQRIPARQHRTAGAAGWLVPTALILLSFIPLIFGALRLIELAGGPALRPVDARFVASPLPVMVHIVSVSVYAVLGAFQFASGVRRRWPGWHRAAGRLVVFCGLLVGLSALWMTLFYPRPEGSGVLLFALRLVFGSGMLMSIVLGSTAIRRGDVHQHRAWMMRGYAVALGAGTQVLTGLVGKWLLGPSGELSNTLLMGAGWGINLAVVEWVIRRWSGQGRAQPLPLTT